MPVARIFCSSRSAGHEDVGLEARRRGVRRDGVRQVAGRGAGDDLVVELLRLRDRDADDPVLERVGRVGGVVLDVDLADAEPVGQPPERISGVRPASSAVCGRRSNGRKSEYRQIEGGPAWILRFSSAASPRPEWS